MELYCRLEVLTSLLFLNDFGNKELNVWNFVGASSHKDWNNVFSDCSGIKVWNDTSYRFKATDSATGANISLLHFLFDVWDVIHCYPALTVLLSENCTLVDSHLSNSISIAIKVSHKFSLDTNLISCFTEDDGKIS